MKYILIISLFLFSCSKEPIVAPQPEADCSDVLVYKHHYVSSLTYQFVYTMQWKRKDGTYFNQDAWGSLYWSKNVGDTRCN